MKSSLKTLIQYIINFNTSVQFVFRKVPLNNVYYNIRTRKVSGSENTTDTFGISHDSHLLAMGRISGICSFFKTTDGTTFLSFLQFCLHEFQFAFFFSSTRMLRALTHASHFLIYLKCTAVWKMYTAVSLSVKRLIASSNACIFHTEGRQQMFLYSCRCGCQSKATYLFIKGT